MSTRAPVGANTSSWNFGIPGIADNTYFLPMELWKTFLVGYGGHYRYMFVQKIG